MQKRYHIFTIKTCKCYLENNELRVVIDYRIILYFSPPRESTGSILCKRAMLFDEYKTKVTYKVGNENAFSRT